MDNPHRGGRGARGNAATREERGNRQVNGVPNPERRGGGGGGGRGRGRGAGRGGGRGRGGGPMGDGIPHRDHHQDHRRPEGPAHGGGRGEDGQRGRGDRHGDRGRGQGGAGRGGRGNGRGGPPQVHHIGLKYLEGLLEKEPSEIAITLSTSAALQRLLEEKRMGHELVQVLCQVFCTAFLSRNDRKTVQHLAGAVRDSGFLRTILPEYVMGMMTDHIPHRREKYPQHLDTIITLLNNVVSIFPASSVRVVSTLVLLLKPAINQLRASGLDIQEETEENLEKIQDLVHHLQEKAREGTLRSDNYAFLPPDQDAPPGEEGDFRTMTIYPTPEEFHKDEKPFLRPNIMNQAYASGHVYLDTHFRLLREDFVRPLREGIRQLLRSQEDTALDGVPLKRRHFDDIRVYFNTRLVVPLCTPSGIAYKVQFDSRPLQFVRWQNSKRLLYGSLVCLSKDNFETFLFATVSDRTVEDLQQGQVLLSFSRDSRHAVARAQPSDSFLMVETTAYFEAYRYVLEGLQEQQVEELPFKRYIVECNKEVHPPAYLQEEAKQFDLSNIAAEDFKDKVAPFNPLSHLAWPSEEQMGLDESQLRALKLALTKELAIIQGPPGTGKTYVGLKIAQALLDNHSAWGRGSPMLVVCYTNHALDQFLEGIHKFLEKGIVRVGGRSSSEALKRFALRELRASPNFRAPQHLRRAKFEIHKELTEAEQHIKTQSAQLECSLRGVIHEQFLENHISDQHWDSLCLQPEADGFQLVEEKRSMIVEWLGLGSSQFQYHAMGANGGGGGDGEDAELDEEEELIQVEEEADLIQAERMLDGDGLQRDPWGGGGGGRGGGGRERERDRQRQDAERVERLAEVMLAMTLGNNNTEEGEGGGGGGERNGGGGRGGGRKRRRRRGGEGRGEGEVQGMDVEMEQAEEDGGEWEIQKQEKRRLKQMMKTELKKSSAMTEEKEKEVVNIWTLAPKDRWKLYRLWIQRFQTDLRTRALRFEYAYQNAAERLSEIRMREDLCVLKEARVIGMTTTGAAKYRQALQEVSPRLVIVEEAAEVLEAHTITTLSSGCRHLILIGDHQQLRPSATVYDLARNFNLEVSMFERLVNIEFPYVRLNYQHRMRPDIARLLTPHIYSELENHPSVLSYENVKGVLSNLFFVEHEAPEEEIKDGRSHQNRHEAHFAVALCRYLLHQDYQPSQITILTTYTGQLHCLKKLMPSSEFSGVKVHVVDKYQGEENDIVILSLVRSNPQDRVGFLSIANRVCVALSRAKKGLYCLGNMAMLSRRVKLWSAILHTLREHGQAGAALTLSCQNHPERRTRVASYEDFAHVPEGGCSLPCEFRLDCGHVCTRACHPYDPEHKEFQCVKECPRVLCELGHRCRKRCYQTCGDCMVPVEKVMPVCQHKQMVPCYQDAFRFVCQEPCVNSLTCGHPCRASCGEPCTPRCEVRVPMQLKCGHTQQVHCFVLRQEDEPPCKTKCGATLKCGHPCPGTCHSCKRGRLHSPCNKKCSHILVCSHECRESCTPDCPPCDMPCENRCPHSKCQKTCGEPCAPCAEPCNWRCHHQRCSKLCHEPCDRPPCTQPCHKLLHCGHQCIGLCGDPCPKKCRECNRDEVTEIFFGTEDEPDARFVQLADCGHVFEVTSMDQFMAQDEGQEAGLDQRAVKLKECPRCRTAIRRNLRYGVHINRCLAHIEKVKEKINANPEDVKRKHSAVKLLLRRQKNLKDHLPQEYGRIKDRLDKSKFNMRKLCHQENLMMFLERLGELQKTMMERMDGPTKRYFDLRLGECLSFLSTPGQRFSEQQVWDLGRELQRLAYLAELNTRCATAAKVAVPLSVEVNAQVSAVRKVLEDTCPFSEDDEQHVKQALADLDAKLPRTGLGITDQERVMIVQAMGLAKGHWYKCPNGHVYAIGDCGGANQRGQCPECDESIGGANHALIAGNAVASEMDGAQHAAWSEAANLANFHLGDL
ncbi:NFX1-type zinc finger-containing protein 1 isoform X2 [Engraulis encrasicolus]|uniref:NFX1-type zinc finger-containing protein 1 isoform X2 n=1 Tax=Engraulis encrasicolus TaxID=184585 RepID=UPI002FD3F6C2